MIQRNPNKLTKIKMNKLRKRHNEFLLFVNLISKDNLS